jgi:hypothetical protein
LASFYSIFRKQYLLHHPSPILLPSFTLGNTTALCYCILL